MRIVLILIDRFGTGKIDALPIIAEHKDFRILDKDGKRNRLLKSRIDGKRAYEISKEKLLASKQLNT